MESVLVSKEVIRPPQPPGPVKWVLDNLFNNRFNSLLTVIMLPVVFFSLVNAIVWIFTEADWRAVTQFPMLYAVGQYPREQLWRIGIGLLVFLFLLGASWGKWGGLLKSISIAAGLFFAFFAVLPVRHPALDISLRTYLGLSVILLLLGNWIGQKAAVKGTNIILGWVIFPVLFIILLAGFKSSELIPSVATTSWGGLLVTFLLAVGGIILSFPIGLLLALGRRSTLPVVKVISTVLIEGIRGVPLITILFMFSIILALFLPVDSRIDRLLRALMAVTIFSAAYTAENVRGGLAAVSPGQIEAAKVVGMNGFQTMVFIVLPQALRAVLPAIVGQFISLFKDTTLVVIVGINDLLGIGRSVINSDPEFVQLQMEVFLFIAVIYWIFSYLMSIASRRLEAAMGVSTRL